ncbi:MAG: hypothetical protein LAO05_12515 [Acidobacteriia bacterium]|nr:hypothetical protein [Terriglobia bacterium]
MKRVRVVAIALAAVLGFISVLQAQEKKPEAWGGVVVGRLTLTATVVKVDPATREVTVKDSEGKTTTVVAGPMVRNFDRIRAGDKVALRYQESVSVVAMSGIDATPSRAQSVDVTGAPLGQKPAGTIVATDEVIAEVVGLKPEDRTVTLKGPLRTVTVQVAEKVKGYDRLKVGDKVVLRVTQALAIEVTAQ